MTPAPDPLAALHDIQLPDPVPFWPPAPGWWVVAAILVALAVVAFIWMRRRRAGPRRAALAELGEIERGWIESRDANALASHLSALLRRVALLRFERRAVASLRDAAWTRFLAEHAGRAGFPHEVGERMTLALCAGPHFQPEPGEAQRWLTSVRAWIERNT
jgi:Domain of unknown function (DUF4381)